LASGAILPIVEQTIIEAPLHVLNDLLHGEILVVVEALLDGAEVNGILDDLEVVRDAKSIWINRFVKNRRRTASPDAVDESFGRFVPAIIQRSVRVDKLGSRNLGHQGWILENLSHYWAEFFEFLKLLFADFLVEAVFQFCKAILFTNSVFGRLLEDFLELSGSECVRDGCLSNDRCHRHRLHLLCDVLDRSCISLAGELLWLSGAFLFLLQLEKLLADVARTGYTSFDEGVDERYSSVLEGVVNEILAFAIFSEKVHIALLDQEAKAVMMPLLHRVEDC
jgi:hypothetical protein